MFDLATTSKKQGDIGLGAAIAYFTEKGYTVLLPLTDSQDYDMAIDENGSLKKVQVKTTSYIGRYGTYQVALRGCGGRKGLVVKHFDPTKIDYVFALTAGGDRYLIPSSIISCKNTISVGAYQQYKIGP